MSDEKDLSALIEVMARLRDPDGGCPWDLAQDFSSIAPHTIEEAYEVADAIARGDMKALREELGDLLLQSVYHVQMASEKGLFDIGDVIRDITAKMISRHPHVFGDQKAASAADVNVIWENRKDQEKQHEGGALSGVALALPALMRAQKLQKKAARTGFEWKDAAPILEKLREEITELQDAIARGDTENVHEEIGDVLFVIANFARIYGVDAEDALRSCNQKFEKRFAGMERVLRSQGRSMNDLTLGQMIDLWRDQKIA